MNITIVTHGYPTPNNPSMFVFVDQLVSAWADSGAKVTVICPIPYFVEYFDKKRFYKNKWTKKTAQGSIITVVSPRYFRFSDRQIGIIKTQIISYYSFQHAVKRVINRMAIKPDILYSHFLPAGCHAGDIGNTISVPAFCAFGESTLWSIQKWDKARVQKSLSKLSGMVSVSTENKRVLIDNKLFREDDITIFPNGVDHSLFYPHNKKEMRRRHGFPENAFIGIFTGSFNDDKGVLRAQEAAVNAGNIPMIYIGGGKSKPKGSNILFCGNLQHEKIPEYLSAADFFVLPTRAEGCCNAIIEAIACGLPIISSNGRFNDDILTDDYSLRVNPNDIQAITEAILKLKEDQSGRDKMSQAAVKAGKQFDIQRRAAAILDYMSRKTREG